MNNPVFMGAHEYVKGRKAAWKGQGLVITFRGEHLEMKFAPHFKSWPKIVRRLEYQGSSCELKLVGKTLSVTTTAELERIQSLLGNRRMIKKPNLRPILVALVLLVFGAISFTLQPHNDSTKLKVESTLSDECGIDYLTNAIISDLPNPNLLNRTTSSLGGIESGTFVCNDNRFSYTISLKNPKRVISLLKLDP